MIGGASKMMANAAICLLVTALLPLTAAAQTDDDFRLKPGARGKLCLECHDEFAETIDYKYLHTPLKDGECTGCHSPHTSNHGMLLVAESEAVCFECHEEIIPEDAKSVHEVVAQGQCLKCHAQHASPNEFLLIKPAGELCFECHNEKKAKVSKVKFKHEPVEESCVNCHSPHASSKGEHLLDRKSTTLCAGSGCHTTGEASFKKAHMGYPVESSRCTSCHDVHGSNRKGLLYNTVHKPVREKKCSKCHMGANSATPLKTKLDGRALCEFCHKETVAETVGKTNVHWPVLGGEGCTNCHSPHASPTSGLLRGTATETCGRCHADSIARQKNSETSHEPVADGECATCHTPHGSDNLFYLVEESPSEMCAECHDWQTHVSHPSGEEIIDPRDKNLRVDCVSCHRTHGSEFKHFTHYEYDKVLCLQCHKELL